MPQNVQNMATKQKYRTNLRIRSP